MAWERMGESHSVPRRTCAYFPYASWWRGKCWVPVADTVAPAARAFIPWPFAGCVQASAAAEEQAGASRDDAEDIGSGFLPALVSGLRVRRAVCTGRPRRQGCAQSCPGRAVACVTAQTLGGPGLLAQIGLMGALIGQRLSCYPPPPSCRRADARPSVVALAPSSLARSSPQTVPVTLCSPPGVGWIVPPGTGEGDPAWKEGLLGHSPVKLVALGEGGPSGP